MVNFNKEPTVIFDRVRERLDALKLTERQASLMASDSRDPNMVGMIKRGTVKNPRIDRLQRLAEVLQTDVAFLTGKAAEPSNAAKAAAYSAGVPLLGNVEEGRYELVDQLPSEIKPVIILLNSMLGFPALDTWPTRSSATA